MTRSRRSKLPCIDPNSNLDNPGLAFYKWLGAHEEGKKEETPNLLEAIKSSSASNIYKQSYERWGKKLKQLKAKFIDGHCISPLAIGLGNDSPLEVGMTFNHTYGMPIIPGSALKGLVRRALAATGQNDAADALLGKQDQAGACVFFDAWYDPNSVGGKPFHRDVVTVHHPEYYKSRGETPPTDFDDPIPLPFLVIKPNAKFLFAIIAPSEDWTHYVLNALGWALENLGIGAKTNSGYGRIKLAGVEGAHGQQSKQRETWKNVTVTFDKSKQELKASRESNRAIADRKTTSELIALLPDEYQAMLKQKPGQILADIEVEPAGRNTYNIVMVLHKEVPE